MSMVGRQALSRELIAATALRLTDVSGLSGLSMRKLGAELGVEAMSLYHYVKNKDDLLDAVLDQMYAEIELPQHLATPDWESGIRAGAHSLHDVLTSHPAALELFSSRPAPSVRSMGKLYWGYDRFIKVGLSPVDSLTAFRSAVSFVLGHVASELGLLLKVKEGGLDIEAIPDPALRDFVRANRENRGSQMFDDGLNSLIAGLRASYNLPG